MTRRKSIHTIHEPFGDAFYYGPERMGTRFENDEEARKASGFSDSTFRTIMDRIEQEAAEVSRLPFFFLSGDAFLCSNAPGDSNVMKRRCTEICRNCDRGRAERIQLLAM